MCLVDLTPSRLCWLPIAVGNSRPLWIRLTAPERLLPYMDTIVVLNSGTIVDVGTYSGLQQSGSLVGHTERVLDTDDEESSGKNGGIERSTPEEELSAPVANPLPTEQGPFARRNGSWSVYGYYYRSAGVITVFLWALSTLVGAVSMNVMRKFSERTGSPLTN
jgi:ATP-binding cassette subfamily C (CFTR/MRP) protein 1